MKAPTKIHLSEVPEQGQKYHYTQKSGELNEALKDLIGQNNYDISFEIRPIGAEAYELKGHFHVEMDLICSRCAFDFKQILKDEINEILIVEEPLPRTGKRKTNTGQNWQEKGPYCNELDSEEFAIDEFTHQIIALAEPIQPLGKADCDDSCPNLIKAHKEGWLDKPKPGEDTHRPFEVLSQLATPRE